MPPASSPENRTIQSVWTRPRGGRERPVLSREQIVAEALRLLDSEGIDALSMRKLGNRLSAGATSLYRHVANKDELIELAVDEIYGEIGLSDAPAAPNAGGRTPPTAPTACARRCCATRGSPR
ncbi:TetR/AcrR family transcriptional regulator [Streptomyces avermitilis]|uniref:TetR/AcrR family transcriptional regulator n=1 Tax=Streptomyces avermitilis TaxID=33903 RepID=UPI003F4D4685